MPRVLCLGYSVTEQVGYVERAADLAMREASGFTFVKSGWGGHSIHAIAYMIDEILDAIACDCVLLELFTGNVRYFEPPALRGFLDQILAATARRGLPVAFLDLYQGGVDYATEPVANLLAEYEACLGIPVLDLAGILAAADDGRRAALLKDGTHVTPAGADFYAGQIHAFLKRRPPATGYVRRFRRLPTLYLSHKLAAMPDQACPVMLRRNGMDLFFAEIPEGQALAVDLGRRSEVRGVMTTYGPKGGTLRVSNSETGQSREVLLYDRFSYYARSIVMNLKMKGVRTLALLQLDGVPKIELAKGEADLGPRIGYLSHVFCLRRLTLSEWLRHRNHRLFWSLQRWRLARRNPLRSKTL